MCPAIWIPQIGIPWVSFHFLVFWLTRCLSECHGPVSNHLRLSLLLCCDVYVFLLIFACFNCCALCSSPSPQGQGLNKSTSFPSRTDLRPVRDKMILICSVPPHPPPKSTEMNAVSSLLINSKNGDKPTLSALSKEIGDHHKTAEVFVESLSTIFCEPKGKGAELTLRPHEAVKVFVETSCVVTWDSTNKPAELTLRPSLVSSVYFCCCKW